MNGFGDRFTFTYNKEKEKKKINEEKVKRYFRCVNNYNSAIRHGC